MAYTKTKLGFSFQIKDQTMFDDKHDLVYYIKCPECHEDYTGEFHERICDHSGKVSKSHMLKHFLKNSHKHVAFKDFPIILNGYTNSKFKRKI